MVSSAAGGCLHPTRPSLLPRGWAEPLGRAGQARGVRRLLRALGTLAVSAWWQHVPRRAELRGTLRWHRCHSLSVLQKLPFTIPELVQSSPCRSSDGVLYTGTRAPPQGPPGLRWGGGPAEWLQGERRARGPGGVRHGVDVLLFAGKKQDTWFVVDPKSGEKQTTLSTEASDGLCPSSPLLYIGRTRKPALLCRVPVLVCPPAPWGPGLPREAGAPQQPAPLLGSVTPTCWGWAGPAAFPLLPLPAARCDPAALLSPQSTSSPCMTPSRGSCAGTPPTPTTRHRSARSPTPTVSHCSPLAGTCGSRPCWSLGKAAAGVHLHGSDEAMAPCQVARAPLAWLALLGPGMVTVPGLLLDAWGLPGALLPGSLQRPLCLSLARDVTLRLQRGRAGGDAGQGERGGPVGAQLRLARGRHLPVAPRQPPPRPPPQPGHGDAALPHLPLAGHPPHQGEPDCERLHGHQDPAAVRGRGAAGRGLWLRGPAGDAPGRGGFVLGQSTHGCHNPRMALGTPGVMPGGVTPLRLRG